MLKKIRMMLKQQEGFTLMELMIVVVIIGILGGIAVPIYNGVQNRAKLGVGQANAEMLNRGLKQIQTFGYDTFKVGDTYVPSTHESLLKSYLGLTGEVLHVEWKDTFYAAAIDKKI